MIEHNYEGDTSFSYTNVSSGFVYTRGNSLLLCLSLSSRFAIVTQFDTVQLVSDRELKLRPWLPAFLSRMRPGGWSPAHPSAPLVKGRAPLCVKRSLHARRRTYHTIYAVTWDPQNSPVQISHPVRFR